MTTEEGFEIIRDVVIAINKHIETESKDKQEEQPSRVLWITEDRKAGKKLRIVKKED